MPKKQTPAYLARLLNQYEDWHRAYRSQMRVIEEYINEQDIGPVFLSVVVDKRPVITNGVLCVCVIVYRNDTATALLPRQCEKSACDMIVDAFGVACRYSRSFQHMPTERWETLSADKWANL